MEKDTEMFARAPLLSDAGASSSWTRIGRAVTAALVMFAAAIVTADPETKLIRQELGSVSRKLESDKDHPLFVVKAFAELEPVQPVRGGIFVIVEVANEGSETLELLRVTHRADVTVRSEDGVELNIPEPGRFSSDDPNRLGAAKRDPHRSPKDFGFMKPPTAWREPRIKTIEDVKDDKIRLAPQERLQLGLLVTKVMCDPEAWAEEIEKRRDPECGLPPPEPPEACPIEAGKYRIHVMITIGISGHKTTWSFDSQSLTVELVEKLTSDRK